jgi:DNA-binding NarL/FixJ family response regulator
MPHGELLRAIRNVYAGKRYLPAAITKSLAERPPDELSTRELDILRLMSKGFSNRKIAGELGITEGTVKWHVNIILSRLQVSDRTQAVLAALQRGIVDLL